MSDLRHKIINLFFCCSIICVSSAGVCNTPSVFVPASQSPSVFVPASPTAGNARRQRAPNQNVHQNNNHQNNHPNHVYPNNNFNNNNYNNNYHHRHFQNNNSAVYVYPYATETYVATPVVTSDDDSYVRNVPDDNNNQNQNQNNSQRAEPNGVWVNAQNGNVPDNAMQYTDANNLETDDGNSSSNVFYCRGVYNNNVVDGILVPQEGCYIDDTVNAATIRLQNYQVLTNP